MTGRDDDGHAGPGHGDVTLTLANGTPDGGTHYRSWDICECSPLVRRLGEVLPEPQHETWATAEQVRATGEAVLSVPGIARLLDDGQAGTS
jgi:hypothetical protein